MVSRRYFMNHVTVFTLALCVMALYQAPVSAKQNVNYSQTNGSSSTPTPEAMAELTPELTAELTPEIAEILDPENPAHQYHPGDEVQVDKLDKNTWKLTVNNRSMEIDVSDFRSMYYPGIKAGDRNQGSITGFFLGSFEIDYESPRGGTQKFTDMYIVMPVVNKAKEVIDWKVVVSGNVQLKGITIATNRNKQIAQVLYPDVNDYLPELGTPVTLAATPMDGSRPNNTSCAQDDANCWMIDRYYGTVDSLLQIHNQIVRRGTGDYDSTPILAGPTFGMIIFTSRPKN